MIILLGLSWVSFSPDHVSAKKKNTLPLTVYDSQSIRVGTLQDEYNKDPSALWVTITLEGYPIVLRVTPHSLQAPHHVEALFLSLDCSGTPFFLHSQTIQGKSMAPLVYIAPPLQTIYVAAQTDRSTFLAPQSKRNIRGACIVLPPGPRITVRPSINLGNLHNLYTPPFFIR